MSFPTWISDSSANRTNKSYLQGFLDISGNLYIRNGKIQTPGNTIEFNDATNYINISNLYLYNTLLIYNPSTLSNIDLVPYINTNDTNITTINSNISTANSNIATNTSSITTINGKIGTLNYDNIYDFTTVNNLFINPGGTIQYEDALGNHPDLIPQVINNGTAITTLQTKTSAQGYNSGTATTSFAGTVECNVVSFLTSINGVNTTIFGYISGLTSSAQTQISARVDKTSTETIGGTKTFSTAPVMSGASITSGTIPITSVVGTAVALSGAQTITGIKTFSAVPVLSGASITSGTIPIASVVGTAMDLTTTQTVAGVKTFSSAPVLSGASITSGTIPIASVVGTAVALSGSQTITGQKTFSTSAPIITTNLRLDGSLLVGTTGGTTITNTQLTYLSTLTSNVQTQLSSMISLSANNTYTGIQSYNNAVNFNSQFYIASASPLIQIENGNTLRQWSNGTTGDTVMELAWDTGASSTGFSLQGGTNGTRGLFGLYFCTNVSAGTRLPIMYSKDTGTQSTNVLTIASGTTATTNLTFSGTLNSVSSTTFGYLDATSSIQTQFDNKAGLGTTNNFTGPNTFSSQLSCGYNGGSALTGQGTEFFCTGQRVWDSSGNATNGDNVFAISLDTGFTRRGLEIQGGESNTALVSPRGSIFGLYYRQPQATGGPTRTPILYGTDLETGAINNTLICPSSLRLDGSLKVGSSGGTTITNTQLGYLSTLSANVQSSINTLATKLTDLTWTAGSPNITNIANTTQTATLTFSGTLNTISTTVFGYLSGVTSNIQTQFTNVNNKLPVGMIIQHPKNNLASPYLLCNGSAVSRSTYSALFTSIGTLYGAGDGSTTFNLPNFQACFLRGSGTQAVGGTTYTAGSVGTPVNDSIIGHTHSGQSGQFLTTSTSSATVNGYASIAVVKPTASNFGNTGGVVSGGGAETAPVHHVIYYYILAL
jgi:hypothetical protein